MTPTAMTDIEVGEVFSARLDLIEEREIFFNESHAIKPDDPLKFAPCGASQLVENFIDKTTAAPIVEQSANGVILNRPAMSIDVPYSVQIEELLLIAVRREDDSVDFYTAP